MNKKIPVKTLYLMGIISIGLIFLGVSSTFAMFTTSSEIENPITLNSTLAYDYDIIDTFEVTVNDKSTETVTLYIYNTTDSELFYTCFYITDSDDIEIGTDETIMTVDSIAAENILALNVSIRNNSQEDITITLGVISSDTNTIVLSEGMEQIPNEKLPELPENPEQMPYLAEKIGYEATGNAIIDNITLEIDATHGIIKDNVGNFRYYGSNPNNYVYFNCNNYSNQSSTTCERWRIIGLVDNKIKIMKNEKIGDYSWDSSESTVNKGTGINQWGPSGTYEGADLMIELNDYYYNGTSGTCYNGLSNASTTCDFSSTGTVRGLKNDDTRNMIAGPGVNNQRTEQEQTYYLMGSLAPIVYTTDSLTSERAGGIKNNHADDVERQKTWNGKIALIYGSDYGFATDLTQCTTQSLFEYNNDACRNNNWMYFVATGATANSTAGTDSPWLLTPGQLWASSVRYIDNNGRITGGTIGMLFNEIEDPASAARSHAVIPALSLSDSVIISGGTGTSSDPYTLSFK